MAESHCEAATCKRVTPQNSCPGSSKFTIHGKDAAYVSDQAEPLHVAARRPQRATAMAATLRIRGRLGIAERVVLHDRKAYMASLSGAVTLAQKQEQRPPTSRNRKGRLMEHGANDDCTAGAVVTPQEDIPTVRGEGTASRGTGVVQACIVQRPLLAAENVSTAKADSGLNHGSINVAIANRRKQCQSRQANKARASYQAGQNNAGDLVGKNSSAPRTLTKAAPMPGGKLIPARINQARYTTPLKHAASVVLTDGSEWTEAEVARLLHVCTHRVKPDTAKFWVKVAKQMPGRTVCQCYEKYYEAQKTPPRQQRAAPDKAPCREPESLLMTGGMSLTAAKKKKVTRNLRWELQAAQGSTTSDLQEKRKRQQRVDAFIDAYKRKRPRTRDRVNDDSSWGRTQGKLAQAKSTMLEHCTVRDGGCHTIDTSAQAVAALKQMHDVHEKKRLRDTPERDQYFDESSASGSE
eukprot:jgi/Ulvmu1/4702/UM002_0433.1